VPVVAMCPEEATAHFGLKTRDSDAKRASFSLFALNRDGSIALRMSALAIDKPRPTPPVARAREASPR